MVYSTVRVELKWLLHDELFTIAIECRRLNWHPPLQPIIVTDMRTPLGGVIGRMKVKQEHLEDDVIDNDLILVWGEQKRIITSDDLLGRLLWGIVTHDVHRAVNSTRSEHAVPDQPGS